MILSFSEFNALYESYNGYIDDESYSNGIDIMEALLTVMNKKRTLTETEVVTFLDNVLEETGWELNEEVYESYAEWLNDWAQFIDEGVNEDESELLFALTKRGENLLNEGVFGTLGKSVSNMSDRHIANKKDARELSGFGDKKNIKNAYHYAKGAAKNTWAGSSKGQKIGLGAAGAVGAAGLGYGAYKGIKALRARSQAKKAAAQPQQIQQPQQIKK